MLPTATTRSSTTTRVIEVGRLRLHTILTPGHTPGSMCFRLEGTPVLFSGDTLFPGGPGNTSSRAATSPTIIRSIEDRLFSTLDRRHARAARPRRRHHDRHRAPPPPGVGRPRLVSSAFWVDLRVRWGDRKSTWNGRRWSGSVVAMRR